MPNDIQSPTPSIGLVSPVETTQNQVAGAMPTPPPSQQPPNAPAPSTPLPTSMPQPSAQPPVPPKPGTLSRRMIKAIADVAAAPLTGQIPADQWVMGPNGPQPVTLTKGQRVAKALARMGAGAATGLGAAKGPGGLAKAAAAGTQLGREYADEDRKAMTEMYRQHLSDLATFRHMTEEDHDWMQKNADHDRQLINDLVDQGWENKTPTPLLAEDTRERAQEIIKEYGNHAQLHWFNSDPVMINPNDPSKGWKPTFTLMVLPNPDVVMANVPVTPGEEASKTISNTLNIAPIAPGSSVPGVVYGQASTANSQFNGAVATGQRELKTIGVTDVPPLDWNSLSSSQKSIARVALPYWMTEGHRPGGDVTSDLKFLQNKHPRWAEFIEQNIYGGKLEAFKDYYAAQLDARKNPDKATPTEENRGSAIKNVLAFTHLEDADKQLFVDRAKQAKTVTDLMKVQDEAQKSDISRQTQKDKEAEEATPVVPLTSRVRDLIKTLKPDVQNAVNRLDTDSEKAAVMEVALGNGSVDFEKVFPLTLRRGVKQLDRVTALGLIEAVTDGKWTEQQYAVKRKMYLDYTSAEPRTPGAQIIFGNTFIRHAADEKRMADDLWNAWSPAGAQTRIQLWNTAVNALKEQAGRPEVTKIVQQTSIVNHEFLNLINAGLQPTDVEKRAQERLNDPTKLSPSQLKGECDTLVNAVKARLESLNDNWKTVMDQDYPNLIYPTNVENARFLGMEFPESFRTGGVAAGMGTQPGMRPSTPSEQTGRQIVGSVSKLIINPRTGKQVATTDAPGFYVVNPANNQVRFMTPETWGKLDPTIRGRLDYVQVK